MSTPVGSSQWMYTPASGFYPYLIDQSLRFDAASESELSRTFASGGNRRKWTFSTWIKRSELTPSGNDDYIFGTNTGAANSTFMFLNWRAGDDLIVTGQSTLWLRSDRVFRDVSGWYHIVWSLDTDNATASQRMRLYVNGSELTSFSTDSRSSLSGDQAINAAVEHNIGRHPTATGYGLGAYLAETNFIDGTALDPTSFGETINGVWVPKAYSGSYGTNGFYLSYADSSAIGDDLSGNTNDFTATNLAASDVVPDSPTNNFATWNFAGVQYGGTNVPTITEGSLKAATSGNPTHIYSTFAIQPTDTQGYYWEVKATSLDVNRSYLGIVAPEGGASGSSIGSYQFRYKFVLNRTGSLYGDDNSAGGGTVSLTSWTTNDILMFAYKNGKFWIGKNGTWMNSGDPAAGTGDLVAQDGGRPSDRGDVTWYPYAGFNSTYTANFGQEGTFAGTETAGSNSDENGIGDFKYSVPSGFLALASANLPEPTISPNAAEQADDYFNTVLYTGTGASNSITGVGFGSAPDFTWIKSRSAAYNNVLWDTVRGATKQLSSNTTGAESTQAQGLTSFDSDGFTLGTNANLNNSGSTYVAWNWKAGGTAVSNTDGSITSSVSAAPDAGFSIVGWTGTGSAITVGHGLGVTPSAIILKNRDGGDNADPDRWYVWHQSFSNTSRGFLWLNDTIAEGTSSVIWNDTAPTSSVFSMGSAYSENGSDFIAYCFADVDSYLKCGSYVGNGSTDGTFVYTGFRPAFVLFKCTTATSNWILHDTARNPYNISNKHLRPNTDDDEDTGANEAIDILSNGFKHRGVSNDNANSSNDTYIYLAFGSSFKYANAR